MKRLCYFSLLFGVFFYSFVVADKRKDLLGYALVGNLNESRLLIEKSKKSLINCRDNKGRTPLLVALEGCADRNNYTLCANLARYFLTCSELDIKSTDKVRNNALHYAACYNCFDLVKPLVQKGCDINACNDNGDTPLHVAVRRNNLLSIDELLKCGADFYCQNNKDNGMTPITLAAHEEYDSVVLCLVNYSAKSPLYDGQTYLHQSVVSSGTQEGLRSIFDVYVKKYGVNVNIKDLKGDTPLHIAVRMDKDDFAKILIEEYGADFDKKNNDGVSPRDIAQQYSQNTSPKLIDRKHRDSAEKLLKLFGKTSLTPSERGKN